KPASITARRKKRLVTGLRPFVAIAAPRAPRAPRGRRAPFEGSLLAADAVSDITPGDPADVVGVAAVALAGRHVVGRDHAHAARHRAVLDLDLVEDLAVLGLDLEAQDDLARCLGDGGAEAGLPEADVRL